MLRYAGQRLFEIIVAFGLVHIPHQTAHRFSAQRCAGDHAVMKIGSARHAVCAANSFFPIHIHSSRFKNSSACRQNSSGWIITSSACAILGNSPELYLRKIAPDKADILFAVLLFVRAVPVGDLRAARGRRLRQGVIVAGPEDIADGAVRIGLEIRRDGIVLLYTVVTGESEPLRWKGRLNTFRLFAASLKDSTSTARWRLLNRYGI